MILIIWYVIFVAIGDVVAYLVGLMVERVWGSYPRMVAFIACIFSCYGSLGCCRGESPNHAGRPPRPDGGTLTDPLQSERSLGLGGSDAFPSSETSRFHHAARRRGGG